MRARDDTRRWYWLRARTAYWLRALRRGWPHLWRLAGLATLLVGGSVLAVVVLVIGEPVLGVVIVLFVLLLTLAEGTYRLSEDTESGAGKAMSVDDLQEFAEAVRLGAFDRDPYGTTPAQSDEQALRVAIADVRQELKTIRLRLDRARADSHFGYDFFLPSEKWNQHSERIARIGASDLRERGDTLYTQLDELNREAQRREHNGSSVMEDDNLDELADLVDELDGLLKRAE